VNRKACTWHHGMDDGILMKRVIEKSAKSISKINLFDKERVWRTFAWGKGNRFNSMNQFRIIFSNSHFTQFSII
jgi:hypothetical protein